MSTPATKKPGQNLKQQVQEVGEDLSRALSRVLEAIPGSPHPPQRLADQLGTTVVNTSRLLKALSAGDPIAVLAHAPGPEPLRRILKSMRGKGPQRALLERAQKVVERFERMIQEEGGDRGSFDAVLATWLPEQRRRFEARRRQAAFKAMSELRGCSCDIDLSTLLLCPSQTPDRMDIACLQATYGLRRMRPGVPIKFGTRRLTQEDDPRHPADLDGNPAIDGLSSVRLDDFCVAPPAPLEPRVVGSTVLYLLGETGFGPRSAVDIVLGELNRSELPLEPDAGEERFFFHQAAVPARRAHFDLLAHRDLFDGKAPRLVVYDTTCEGPAVVNDPLRASDQIEVSETVQSWDAAGDALHGAGIPRYSDLVTSACGRLGWELADLRLHRLVVEHPLLGMQLCLSFG